MKIKELIAELSKLPPDYELEYHEETNYKVFGEFCFEDHSSKKEVTIMMGK